MKTSYFARLKEIENPISICGKAPDWYKGPQFKKLAPKLWFFELYKSGEITSEEYTEAYYAEVLNHLDPQEIVNKLIQVYNTKDFTLICYEKPEDFCHRHLVAEWLKNAGYDIEEL